MPLAVDNEGGGTRGSGDILDTVAVEKSTKAASGKSFMYDTLIGHSIPSAHDYRFFSYLICEFC